MFRSLFESALAEYAATGHLSGFSGGDGSEDNPPKDPPKDDNNPPKDPPKPPKVEFDEAQQAELNRLLAEERREAEKRAAAAERAKLQKEKDDAAAEAQRKKDEEAGEYEKVKGQLVSERDEWKGKFEVLETDYKALEQTYTEQYNSAVERLPEIIAAFKPADDAKLSTKIAWLKTAQEQADKLGEGIEGGSRPNPRKPNGGNPPDKLDFKKERIGLFG